jgi:Uma2 family endonuclease
MIFPTTLKGRYLEQMTDDEFSYFCRENGNLKIERLPNREILIQEPTFFYTGEQNSEIIYQLRKWNKEHQLGRCVDSDTGFFLKNGAMRNPDAAWVSNERLKSIDPSELRKFPHLCPDFIIELKSSSDSLSSLKEKMNEWMTNGCAMAWLIDPGTETVFVYEGQDERVHNSFDQPISGDPILPGFQLVLAELRIS